MKALQSFIGHCRTMAERTMAQLLRDEGDAAWRKRRCRHAEEVLAAVKAMRA